MVYLEKRGGRVYMDIKKGGVLDFFFRVIKKILNDDVNNVAAALAYYLIFSFFPFIMVLSVILGYAHIDAVEVVNALSNTIPKDVVNIIERYLYYVSAYKSSNIMAVSIFFTLYFPMRAVNYIIAGIDRAYYSHEESNFFVWFIISLIFSVFFVLMVITSLILLAFGRGILEFLSKEVVFIPESFINTWVYIRFVIMAAMCLVIITALYSIAPKKRIPFFKALPGAVAAVSLWIIVSAIFSYYVETMAKYSIVFGSIGAIIVLLLWLYMTAAILIIGAEINSVLEEMQRR